MPCPIKQCKLETDCDAYAAFILARRLLHCSYAADYRLLFQTYSSLSGHAALASPHGIAPSWIEVNCLQSAVVDKAAELSIYWLGDPSAANGFWAVVQISLKSGNAANGKLVWNQHYSDIQYIMKVGCSRFCYSFVEWLILPWQSLKLCLSSYKNGHFHIIR